ncbi:MAG: pyridoxamine 5'-phosphate oxidase [Pyrinomonadaceae bacterium]
MTELNESTAPRNPLQLFRGWFAEARQHPEILMPEAMTLATADQDRRPSARMVLLKSYDERGFVFYTNYNSRKARELEANPYAALVIYWVQLDYQIRVEGTVARVSNQESDVYFQTRPRESQIGALASPQSEIVSSREELETRARELEAFHGNRRIKRPEYWGGYRLNPARIEFWKARPGRLHDRILYERQTDGDWKIQRLAP